MAGNQREGKTSKEMIDAQWNALMFKTRQKERVTTILNNVEYFRKETVQENRLLQVVDKFEKHAAKSVLGSSKQGYLEAAHAARELDRDLQSAKVTLDKDFQTLREKKNEVLRAVKGAPKLTEENIIKTFNQACQEAKRKRMPAIEANHSIVEDIYVEICKFFKSIEAISDLFEDETYQSTREITQEFKSQYDAVVPADEGDSQDSHTLQGGNKAGSGVTNKSK